MECVKRFFLILATMSCVVVSFGSQAQTDQLPTKQSFSFIETTIADIHRVIQAQSMSCVDIVAGFVHRIHKYDEISGLNAIVYVNPAATKTAAALDADYGKTKQIKPLHCVPVILKDNYDTADMPTEAGAIALSGSIPTDDAFLVKKLRQAGAIIVAKSNMGEWAFSPQNTISSTHGETKNAYDLTRVPAGSSGGTASAIAANFGVIGMGTDTGNSIRGPSSHLALVGIRPTMGTTSRDGIVPLLLNRDVGGPMLRTVKDTATVFSVLAGVDPADPVTETYQQYQVQDYTAKLSSAALYGIRLGVLREIYDAESADAEVMAVFDQALKDLTAKGATIIDAVTIPNFQALTQATGFCSRFRYDLDRYLSGLSQSQKLRSLKAIIEQKQYRAENQSAMDWATSIAEGITPSEQQPPCVDVQGDPRRKALLDTVVATMDALNIDALVYPTWSNPPRKLGDNNSPHGNNSPMIAPHTGQPAITVPMGYASGYLPLGLQILGRPFSEQALFRYAYAYEQATQHRKPPLMFP